MSLDFIITIFIGLIILLIFWSIILVFIFLRNPPKSKLTINIVLRSYLIFGALFLILLIFYYFDSF